jgi:hypothetical protein
MCAPLTYFKRVVTLQHFLFLQMTAGPADPGPAKPRIRSSGPRTGNFKFGRSVQTLDVVDLPLGHEALPSRRVFKVKRNEHGKVDKYKTRLVAKGFLQNFGENFVEVFATTSNLTAVRLLIAYAAYHKLDAQQIDVKTAFLNGEIKDEVYLICPPRVLCLLASCKL